MSMTDQAALCGLTFQASAVTWPFTAISTIMFGIKVFTRARLLTDAMGWDDIVLSIAWIFDIIRAGAFQKSLDSTRKISHSNPSQTIPSAAFWVIFTDAWAFISIALPKLGIGILLIRLFNPQRWLRTLIMTICVALNVLALVGLAITFAQCSPAAGQWDPWRHPRTHCWKRNVQIIYACTVSAMSAFLDLAFSIYPGVVIWRLQMALWKRLGTMALMSLGFASFAIAIVKLVSNTTLLGDPDVNTLLYDGIHIAIWNGIENDFVLTAACLPSVPPFFRACSKILGKQFTSITGRSSLSSGESLKSSTQAVQSHENSSQERPRGSRAQESLEVEDRQEMLRMLKGHLV